MVEATHVSSVEVQLGAVRNLVAGLDPDWVPLSEAPRMWQAFEQIARASGAAQLLLARRVEESGIWEREGCRSAAEHLARRSGGSVRSGREALRTSRRLGDVPVVEDALRRGELSVTQAEVVTDAAVQDPARQADLVEAAGRLSLAELAQECGRVKAAADPDPEATPPMRTPTPDTAQPLPTARAKPLGGVGRGRIPGYLALLRLDVTALQRGDAQDGELCEITGIGPVPVSVARRLLGDAVLKLVLTKGVDVANVTHLGRAATVPPTDPRHPVNTRSPPAPSRAA